MSDEDKSVQAVQPAEGDLLDYWRIIWTRWWLIGALVVVSAITAYIISKQQPKIYVSTITVMATVGGPGEGRGGFSLGDVVKGGGAGSVLGWLGPLGGATKDKTMALLKTITLAKEIVDKFNLKEAFRTTSDIKAAQTVLGKTGVTVNKEGAMLITVEDTDPKRAADIANYYPEALDRVLARFSVTNVSRQRVFIEGRRAETQEALRQAEENLRAFQEKKGVVVPPERQTPESVSASIGMRNVIMNMEVELEAMRRYSTEQNPDFIVLQKRLQEMKKQFSQMQYGSGMELPAERANPGQPRKDIFVPSARVPELALEFQRLAREVKVQETVYQVLTSQLETTKIEEARNLPTIEILDRAIPPDSAVRPRTRQTVIFAAAAGSFLGVFLAFFLEYLGTLRLRRKTAASSGYPNAQTVASLGNR